MVRIRPGVARVQVDTWRATYRGVVPEAFLRGAGGEVGPGPEDPHLARPAFPGRVQGGGGFRRLRAGSGFWLSELWALYVLPAWQGKGLGRALFQGGSVGLGPPGAGLLRAPGRGAFAGGTELWEVACGFDLGG
ncbi:GNAT family N-acetyltransferase [Thermus islandicus]|uniref:GNAT family N-acetyltransferase n=1 Tax=Thermus islandicus TaxID=540988 RepID=UPI0004114463|nr:GNAT family N-acetyltransferase [Thermus islandicus]